ncbi:phage major capsid protein [Leptothrix discophora]|uniref:Phage major capsid protein n=1 Tax=Leptothrix discophora TaxID=89 RepID=A0ABT9G2F4_LEPDI|nr:phage major capsid protein [Leptothrix discophora]MDP4300348.1 phage major capsid protein [Leptothrix discophora]
MTVPIDRTAIPDDVRQATTGIQRRAFAQQRAQVDEQARTVDLCFASELPYDRWFGTEILDCTAAAVDLSRLNGRHPLLLNHRPDQQIGVVERAWIDTDRRARATVRFSRSALGEEVMRDVIDGIRELVSVGYAIDEMVLEARTDTDATYRVTRWTPYEVSLVSIPADPTVGIGRSLAAPAVPAQKKETPVSDATTLATTVPVTPPVTPPAAAPAAVDVRVIETDAIRRERERISVIRAMGSAHKLADEADRAVNDGTTVDAFRAAVLDRLTVSGSIRPAEKPELGLSPKDQRGYSITRLMRAMLDPHDSDAQKAAAFEIECSVQARKLRPLDEQGHLAAQRGSGFTVPVDILQGNVAHQADAARDAVRLLSQRLQQRDLTVGTPTAGGNLVATDLLAGSFIDLLRNRMVIAGLGATVLDGLSGNIAIPSQTAGAATYWVDEGVAVTESQAAFGQVTMTPRTVGMFTDYSRKTLLQPSLSIEALVRADLAMGIAVEIDRVALAGSGSAPQPRGVLNTAGIGAVAIGANGGVPTYEHMVALEEAIALANADIGSMAYVTNAKMRARLKLTQVFGSTNGQAVWADNSVNGYPAAVTQNCPANLTKGTAVGTCSAIVFGAWRELLMGFWSGLDLVIDPITLSTSGGRRIIALQDMDIAVRRPASFAAVLDALRS